MSDHGNIAAQSFHKITIQLLFLSIDWVKNMKLCAKYTNYTLMYYPIYFVSKRQVAFWILEICQKFVCYVNTNEIRQMYQANNDRPVLFQVAHGVHVVKLYD